MNKIPLTIRLLRLEDGEPSDPSCIQSMIQNMADTPISVYLCGFDDKLDWLMATLNIPAEQTDTLTYRAIAGHVTRLEDKALAAEAIKVLALPFYQRFKERVVDYEKNST